MGELIETNHYLINQHEKPEGLLSPDVTWENRAVILKNRRALLQNGAIGGARGTTITCPMAAAEGISGQAEMK